MLERLQILEETISFLTEFESRFSLEQEPFAP